MVWEDCRFGVLWNGIYRIGVQPVSLKLCGLSSGPQSWETTLAWMPLEAGTGWMKGVRLRPGVTPRSLLGPAD